MGEIFMEIEKERYSHLNFGEYIEGKRKQRKITLREMARMMGITAPYLSDVEKNRRNAFDLERLELMCTILEFSEEERIKIMDLAGENRHEVTPDIKDYIIDNYFVTKAIRTAKELKVSEEEWLEIVGELKRRKSLKL